MAQAGHQKSAALPSKRGAQPQPQQSDRGRAPAPPDTPLLDALAVTFGCGAVAFLFHRYAPAPYMVHTGPITVAQC